ncbi:hypothetical protein VTO42DRAFT_3736 [Malbranchea cinnamomea]
MPVHPISGRDLRRILGWANCPRGRIAVQRGCWLGKTNPPYPGLPRSVDAMMSFWSLYYKTRHIFTYRAEAEALSKEGTGYGQLWPIHRLLVSKCGARFVSAPRDFFNAVGMF